MKATEMDTSEKIKALAEFCGWTEIYQGGGGPITFGKMSGVKGNSPRWPIPDFGKDLNAIHEVERLLTCEQRREYVRNLFRHSMSDFDCHCATARMRMDAILVTLEPSKPKP